MDLDISDDSLPVFAALSNDTRLKIIRLLSQKKMSVREIADAVHLSSAITTMHLNKLEEAKIIRTERVGKKRISVLQIDTINISFPQQLYIPFDNWKESTPVGQFTRYEVFPSCGLAGPKDFIGKVDDPSYFMDPNRFNAGMIWFSKGYVEYQVPNHLATNQKLEMIEISAELSSEFPFSNNNWPSDISVTLDGLDLGTWTSPGDFSDIRGRYTPDWVYNDMNQYGLLTTFRVSKHGTFINGHHSSSTTIDDLDMSKPALPLRFTVHDNAKNVGGCTIFGKGFGNHDQNIESSFYYQTVDPK